MTNDFKSTWFHSQLILPCVYIFFAKHAVNRAIIFLYYWTQCFDGSSLLWQRYVRKANDTKNPAILTFFFVTKRPQLNAAHAQLLKTFWPIAFA